MDGAAIATLLLAAAAAALVLVAATARRRAAAHCTTTVHTPRRVPSLPLLGCVPALAQYGAAVIAAARGAFGPRAFELPAAPGQRLVFVFDAPSIEAFLRSPESVVAFKPAVRRFTERVYGLPGAEFAAAHETLLLRLRSLLAPAELRAHADGLLATALPLLRAWGDDGGAGANGGSGVNSSSSGGDTGQTVELWAASKTLVFQVAGRQLFGSAFFDRWGGDWLQETFFVFEENFEVAASPVPHLLLPAFRAARRRLLRALRASLAAGDFDGTLAGSLLQGCGLREALHPNVLLAVLWASQANSVAAMFWTLAFLLLPENAAYLRAVRAEVAAAVADERRVLAAAGESKAGGTDGDDRALLAAVARLALDRRSAAARCVAEAIRLRAHSVAVRLVPDGAREIVLQDAAAAAATAAAASCPGNGAGLRQRREGVEEQQQQQQQRSGSSSEGDKTDTAPVRVARGQTLAICPFLSHADPALFPGPSPPDAFDPNRAPIALSSGAVAPGVAGLGFGGGAWRCPGRFFAELELAALAMAALATLDLRLLGDGGGGGSGKGSSSEGGVLSLAARVAAKLLPANVAEWGGVGGESSAKRFAAVAARWAHLGDPGERLPPAELRRLVGFKVPSRPLVVGVAPAAVAV